MIPTVINPFAEPREAGIADPAEVEQTLIELIQAASSVWEAWESRYEVREDDAFGLRLHLESAMRSLASALSQPLIEPLEIKGRANFNAWVAELKARGDIR